MRGIFTCGIVWYTSLAASFFAQFRPQRCCRECSFDLTTDAVSEEEVMHVYAWFQATTYHHAGNGKITVRPRQASPSVYLGGFQV